MIGHAESAALDAPVVLVVFNRPALTSRVFETIRRARPRRLLLVADGPRPGVVSDVEQCRAAREAVANVDWDCEVSREYADSNLGCGRRVASGLDWAFETVERAIVLEDDCLPDDSFFPFAAGLLERYAADDRVAHIGGMGVPGPRPALSYFFSAFPFIWGWATWRRAWRHYDRQMKDWPEVRESGWLDAMWRNGRSAAYWRATFDMVHSGALDTWDIQWMYCCWRASRLSVVPCRNLITNLGVGEGATHTDSEAFSVLSERPLATMPAELAHPGIVVRSPHVDGAIQARWESVYPLARVEEVLRRSGAAE